MNHKKRKVGANAIYFDSRDDKTKNFIDGRIRTEKEDHYSIIEEPDSKFLGYFAMKKNEHGNNAAGITKAKIVCDKMFKFFNDNGISLENLKAIGCDGTPLNTGPRGGIIRFLEIQMKRAMQWMVCMIHCNELPLRHLIITVDGTSKSPTEFKGPIGKKLSSVENLKIVRFNPINLPNELSNISHIRDKLSTDQQYLFDVCCAISTGICSKSLEKRSPGKMNHARWLTTANRVLRLYMSTTKPSTKLLTLVQYIMFSYAPSFFDIKHKSSVLHASIHLANIIKSSQFLPKNYRTVVNNTIQRNGFYAHPENVLLAMLNDERQEIRYQGWIKILQAREKDKENNSNNVVVREFVIPKLNFNCEDYTSMIDLENENITSPPILNGIDIDLDNIINLASEKISEMDLQIDLNSIPCHTQAVERAIKIVTEASCSLYDNDKRLGFILNTLNSRNNMANFETKKNFVVDPQSNQSYKI